MCPKEDSAEMNGLPARNSPEWDNQENEEQEEEEVEYLEGSAFTKIEILRYIVSLKDFVDLNEGRSETSLCEIWDSIQTSSVATVYHENGLFEIVQHIFDKRDDFDDSERNRLLELLIGIMANMLQHLEAIDELDKVLQNLASFCEEETDVFILAQTMRALSIIFKRFRTSVESSSLISTFKTTANEIICKCKNEEALSNALNLFESNDVFLDANGQKALWTFLEHFEDHEIEEIMTLEENHFLQRALEILSEVIYQKTDVLEEKQVGIINSFWDRCNKEAEENKEEFSCINEPWQFFATILYLAQVSLQKCAAFEITQEDLKRTFKSWKLSRHKIGGSIRKTLRVQISNLNKASRFDEIVEEESETEKNILSILDSQIEDDI